MDAVADLLSWAATQGVEIGSVRPSDIDGHGLGMVATRNIEVLEPLSIVKYLLTINSKERWS
jgi:hypothetical protein